MWGCGTRGQMHMWTRGQIGVLRAAMDPFLTGVEARYIFGLANKPEVLKT